MAVRSHSALAALKGTSRPVVHSELSKLKWARQARPHAPIQHDRPSPERICATRLVMVAPSGPPGPRALRGDFFSHSFQRVNKVCHRSADACAEPLPTALFARG